MLARQAPSRCLSTPSRLVRSNWARRQPAAANRPARRPRAAAATHPAPPPTAQPPLIAPPPQPQASYAKKQTLGYKNGYAVPVELGKPSEEDLRQQLANWTIAAAAPAAAAAAPAEPFVPAFVALDKKVRRGESSVFCICGAHGCLHGRRYRLALRGRLLTSTRCWPPTRPARLAPRHPTPSGAALPRLVWRAGARLAAGGVARAPRAAAGLPGGRQHAGAPLLAGWHPLACSSTPWPAPAAHAWLGMLS